MSLISTGIRSILDPIKTFTHDIVLMEREQDSETHRARKYSLVCRVATLAIGVFAVGFSVATIATLATGSYIASTFCAGGAIVCAAVIHDLLIVRSTLDTMIAIPKEQRDAFLESTREKSPLMDDTIIFGPLLQLTKKPAQS